MKNNCQNKVSPMNIDLLKNIFFKKIIKSRLFQFMVQLPLVVIFLLVIVAGIQGIPDPGLNIATIATWTVWWVGIVFLIFFLGAAWCLICPWAALADWIERLSFWKKTDGISFEKKWPKFLRNRHPATIFFIVVTWFELGIFITYSPFYTAYVAFGMLFITVLITLVYEKKTFCRYFCFVGGIVGMYSNLSPVEIRSKSEDVCKNCKTKDCITGNEKGYGCPIFEYPGGMNMNSNCILCTECIKTCPHDNMTFRLRPFLTDLVSGFKGRFDESLLILTLLSLTLLHGFTMLPIWTTYAGKAFNEDYYSYMLNFTLAELFFCAVVILIHLLLSILIKFSLGKNSNYDLKSIFTRFSYAFLPIAFFYHLSHNIHHLDMEGLKIVPVLSDPFGYGWNLFGTREWQPFSIIGMDSMSAVQTFLLLLGFLSATYIAYTTTRLITENKKSLLPMIPFILVAIFYGFVTFTFNFQPMVMRTVSFLG
ncbi:MAG: 4Fe-4S binding protein [Nitrospinae bacterium]|nr:4Fe-4S binding protein [Nitrospinota bacterium]